MLLENKVAIVTGGSRGIGYATVEAFCRREQKLCCARAVRRPLTRRWRS